MCCVCSTLALSFVETIIDVHPCTGLTRPSVQFLLKEKLLWEWLINAAQRHKKNDWTNLLFSNTLSSVHAIASLADAVPTLWEDKLPPSPPSPLEGAFEWGGGEVISVLLCGARQPAPLICGQSQAKSSNRTNKHTHTHATGVFFTWKPSASNRDESFWQTSGAATALQGVKGVQLHS